MSVMGFDPMADRGKPPFTDSDNMLRFGEELGVGLRDLNQNEVTGVPIAEARFDFAAIREKILRETQKS
jgi:hypothetical protein